MNTNYIILAQNLQRLMDEKGVDRNKLCEDLGFKYVTVSSWLEAKKYPRIDKIEMLANYFNVTKAHLTEQWYTQQKGVPHLYDSKKSAPAEPGRSKEKEIEKMLRDLSDSELDKVAEFIAFLLSQRKGEK